MDHMEKSTENGTPSGFVPERDTPSELVPQNKTQPPFTATIGEKVAVPVSYVVAFLYTYIFTQSERSQTYLFFTIFALLFCVATELFYRKRKPTWESWIWLGCIWVSWIGYVAGTHHVWASYTWFFVHAYAIYWVLARSGRLLGGESSHFAPIDAFNGLILFPFKHFFLRVRVVGSTVANIVKRRGSLKAKLSTIIAVAIAAILFSIAGSLLSAADQTFQTFVNQIVQFIRIDNLNEIIIRFILSLPIGAYLYGLVVGTNREMPEKLKHRGDVITRQMEMLRKVPAKVWVIILGAFSILYLVFFVIQGSYLFGAFTRTLPENFTVAQYARQGFFELCGIMALNFGLLWVVVRSSESSLHMHKALKIMCTALLCESILFSVTAFSKLYLYISCFGFTPLRLQSAWLICVLFAGCAASLYSIWMEKRSMKFWILFSGITLALLHIY